MTFFYLTCKLKISLNLKQYYNSRFNKKPLLIELVKCFLKEYLQYFYDFFYLTFKLKISLNLKQYYNSRFNKKIIKLFKKSIEILSNLLYLYLLVSL